MENQSPLRVSSPKLSSSKAKCSLPVFCKQLLLVPSWALIFCKKFNPRAKAAFLCSDFAQWISSNSTGSAATVSVN
jgi:hypothetical protein